MTIVIGPCDRLLLLGGGTFLVDLARWARSQGLQTCVLTAPRHAQHQTGPGNRSLGDSLTEFGIEFGVFESIRDPAALSLVGPMDRTFALSLGAAWIFPRTVIDEVFDNKLFNLHGTRLPQNRGGGGFTWQILMGNRLGFCTLHRVDPGVDTGDIVAQEEFLYPASCRSPADYQTFYRGKCESFLRSILLRLKDGPSTFETLSQPEYLSTYWPRLSTVDHGWIDWHATAEQIERLICGFDDPYPGAQTFWGETKVHLKGVLVDYNDSHHHPFQTGLVYRNNGRWLNVATSGPTLIVQNVVGPDPSAANLIPEIKVGDRFHTSANFLEGVAKRVFYTPNGKKH